MYISTKSVVEAFLRLSANDISDSSLLHISMILKGLGYNEIDFKNLDRITKKSAEIAFSMCANERMHIQCVQPSIYQNPRLCHREELARTKDVGNQWDYGLCQSGT